MISSTPINKPSGNRSKLIWIFPLVFVVFLAQVCFCTQYPAALAVSFIFNAIFIGSNLFASLAQEREKCTIDALRLTQLTSLQILQLKSQKEIRTWALGNAVLLAVLFVAAFNGNVGPVWFLLGFMSMAAGGLFSIGLALAVSTRSETTSSAVVRGWIAKGVWLLGFPILDQVIGAVFVTKKQPIIFSYLDPLWTAKEIALSTIYETSGLLALGIVLGIGASVVLAFALALQSSRLIDSSFESPSIIEDRVHHPIYKKTLAFNMHDNPFFLREMAWQLRSGAGKWPGYLVFITLFIAPFLYGVAQSNRVQDQSEIRIVRKELFTRSSVAPTVIEPAEDPHTELAQLKVRSGERASSFMAKRHSMLCFLRFMNFPVDRNSQSVDGLTLHNIITSSGRVMSVSSAELNDIRQKNKVKPAAGFGQVSYAGSAEASGIDSSALKKGLADGLMMGLLLAVLYLFVRGGAFVAASVTGERERRSWDQISLTGVDPATYVAGKLAAVLSLPLLQLLAGSLALLLFVVYGVISLFQLFLLVLVLALCFTGAAAMGMAFSATCPTSHQAQGATLAGGALLLFLPLFDTFGVRAFLLGCLILLVAGKGSQVSDRLVGGTIAALVVFVCGPFASPMGAILALCGSSLCTGWEMLRVFGPTGGLILSAISMFGLTCVFYNIACRRLEDGGSVS